MEASTNHTKLKIGTKTKHLKIIETYCQQQHRCLKFKIQKTQTTCNTQQAASTHFYESSSSHKKERQKQNMPATQIIQQVTKQIRLTRKT